MIIEQLESKILSGGGLNSLTDSELSQLALHFVGDAPPSHVPRETVISILSEQDNVKKWQQGVVDKARQLASSKISETVENVQSKILIDATTIPDADHRSDSELPEGSPKRSSPGWRNV